MSLADYCPYVQEFTWRANNVVIRGSHCYYDQNNPGNPILNQKFQIIIYKKKKILEEYNNCFNFRAG